jgi:carbonic anhydrase
MPSTIIKRMLKGYEAFREKYVHGENSVMQQLATDGQQAQIMVVACCDSRVDPALILQCDPGDLFVVRNVANIVPPFEKDSGYHGISAALEFGIKFLKVKHLILLGHTQCGGINALLNAHTMQENDFISKWVSVIDTKIDQKSSPDELAKKALNCSYQNCLSFPWINDKIECESLIIHRWFFDIEKGEIFAYDQDKHCYNTLSEVVKI